MSGLGAMMAGGNPNEERGRQRKDFYPTPPEVTRALIRRYPQLGWMTIWEPCAGNGAMARELQAAGATLIQSDIEPQAADITTSDFLEAEGMAEDIDAIVTNPPFELAEPMIRKALAFKGVSLVAFVLKSTYWHAAGRQKLFQELRPSAVHPLTWRPDFLGLGRPTMEAMWCVWDAGRTERGTTIYEPLNK